MSTTQNLQLAIVGCGGMGTRHLYGLQELQRSGVGGVDLIAVCDLLETNAGELANQAEQRLGRRPRVFNNMRAMREAMPELEAVDVTTESGTHHKVAVEALGLGFHVMVEKPIALTVRGSRRMIDAAKTAGKILAVAENYRRDPMNRLARALLDDGAIGRPYCILNTSIGGSDRIIILPWRHLKDKGGIVVDAGIHDADVLQFLMGKVQSAYGKVEQYEPVRYRAAHGGATNDFYARWRDQIPEQMTPTAEDAMYAFLNFENGVVGQWIQHYAGHGRGLAQRFVYGSKGNLELPRDRSGNPIRLSLDDGTDLQDERILDYAPSYKLDSVATALFGSERPWHYTFTFPECDRKLIAIEYADFAHAIRTGGKPEVDGEEGLSALAALYAAFESSALGRVVTTAEVESGEIDAYQRDLNE